MLIQRDVFHSYEPNRLVSFRKTVKYNPVDLNKDQLIKLVSEGIEFNEELAGERIKREPDKRDQNLIRNSQYNGWLSGAAARSIRNLVTNWAQCIEMNSDKKTVDSKRIYPLLLTLTLPTTQLITDETAKECINRFVRQLNRQEDTRWEAEKREIEREYSGKANQLIRDEKIAEGYAIHLKALRKYMWVAECQKNGNIHFHMILDEWCDKDDIRTRWNNALEYVAKGITCFQHVQRLKFRIRLKTQFNSNAIWAINVKAWKPGRVFIYKGFEFVLDQSVQKMKIKSIRDKMAKAIQLQRLPNMTDERPVLGELFTKAMKERSIPTYKTLLRKTEELQVRAFCKAVDNGFSDPPTTRIESMRNKNNMAAYLAKYVAKATVKEKREKVDLQELAELPGYEMIGGKLFDSQENEVLPAKVTATTVGRPIRGRLWGRSKALSLIKDFGYFKVKESSITSYAGMVETGVETKSRVKVKKVPTPTLYGETEYIDVKEIIHTQHTTHDYHKACGERSVKAVQPYYETLKSFLGPDSYWQDTQEDRAPNITVISLNQRLTKKSTGKEGKRPLIAWNQKQLLHRFAPDLEQAYVAHYHDLFYTIYNGPAHTEPGVKPFYNGIVTSKRFECIPELGLQVLTDFARCN